MAVNTENPPGVQDQRFGWKWLKRGTAVVVEGLAPTVVADMSRDLRNSKIKPESTDSWATLMQAGSAYLVSTGRPISAGIVYAGSKVLELGEVATKRVKKGFRRGR